MTLSAHELLIYAGAVFILVLTPGLVAIVAISQLIPLVGNLAIAGLVHHVRGLLSSPVALKRTNWTAGILLICVGLLIPFV